MSVEHGREFGGYLEYQRRRRPERALSLGNAATLLFLATVDLGLSGAGNPSPELHAPAEAPEIAPVVELDELRAARQHRLAGFAAEAAELGYAQAA